VGDNPNFQRVTGTGSPNKQSVYQPTGEKGSFVLPVNLNKVSLVPMATLSKGASAPTPEQPNPLYESKSVRDTAVAAKAGSVAGIHKDKIVGAFNSSFFNTDGPKSSMSYATLVNGKVASAGKVETGVTTKAVIWDNHAQSVKVIPWTANTSGGHKVGDAKLASLKSVETGFGSAVGKAGSNGLVGIDPLAADRKGKDPAKDMRNERGAGTYIGVNGAGKGKMAVLVTSDLSPRQAVQQLKNAGYGNVVALDSGPSSQLTLKTTRDQGSTIREKMEQQVISERDRMTPMPIGIVEK
jgi:hypothetical protein